MSALETTTLARPPDDPREHMRDAAKQLQSVTVHSPPFLALLAPILLFFLQDFAGSARAMATAIAHHDPWVRASGHAFRARFAENDGDLAAVRADCAAAVVGFDAVGDRWGLANVLPLQALLMMYDGDLDGAERALLAAEEIRVDFHSMDTDDQLFGLLRLADIDVRRGDRARAGQRAAQALLVAEQAGAPEMLAMTLCLTSGISLFNGEREDAGKYRDRAVGLLEQALVKTFWGADHGSAMVGAAGGSIALYDGDLDEARTQLALGLAAARSTRDMPINAAVGMVVADYVAHRGDPHLTAQLIGGCARLRGADDPTQPEIARISAATRAEIGDEAYDASWQAGWALDREQALDLLAGAVAE